MEETIYSITLANGDVLDGLRLNGNNYISTQPVTEEMFEYNLSHVTITDNNGHSEEHTNMTLVQVSVVGQEYWFIIRDITEEELAAIKVRSDLEYVAMMTGVEL